jgi:sulfite exporter TauE/SafE
MSLALAAFFAGLLGGVHCAGMCGGIAAALAAASRGPAIARQAAFKDGRIASYGVAGAAAGLTGGALLAVGPLVAAQTAMFVVANALMLMLGLYIAGWSRMVVRMESAGGVLWRRLEPLRRSVMPIDSTAKALAAGALWGWVPCGLVYGMLTLALAAGGALEGALVMLAFGLGTLPNLLAAGFAAQRMLELRSRTWVRQLAGTVIVALAIVGLARVPGIAETLRAGWLCLT